MRKALKRAKNLRELKEQFNEVSSTIAGDTRWSAQAILFIAEALTRLERNSSVPTINLIAEDEMRRIVREEWLAIQAETEVKEPVGV